MEPSFADFDFEGAVHRAIHDVRKSRDLIMRYQRNREDVLRTLASSHLDEMRQDWHLTQRFVASNDDQLRIAALLLMRDYWGVRLDFSNTCSSIAFGDQSPIVRGVALYTLLKCYKTLSNPLLHLLKCCFGSSGQLPIICDTIEREEPSAETTRSQTGDLATTPRMRFLTKMGGSHTTELLENLEFAKVCLQSLDPNLRIAALVCIKEYHTTPDWFFSACEQAALQDSNESVRSIATSMLGGLYENTKNARVLRLLAGNIFNESETISFRRTAYNALLRVLGVPIPWHKRGGGRRQTSLSDINWDLVRESMA